MSGDNVAVIREILASNQPRDDAFARVVVRILPAVLAELERLRVDVANYTALNSKVNDAINRAGIHCALDFWEAIDEIASERDALKVRRNELLTTIQKLSRDVPYDEEKGAAATLIAEVGTLRAKVTELTNERNEQWDKRRGTERERNALLKTVQRESAWVNERDGVIAHLVGVLHEVVRCAKVEDARTFAEIAISNLAEYNAGTWLPGPRDDAADWKEADRG